MSEKFPVIVTNELSNIAFDQSETSAIEQRDLLQQIFKIVQLFSSILPFQRGDAWCNY